MIHDFPLSFVTLLGQPLYWYGAVYTAGYLGVFLWFSLRRRRLGWSVAEVFEFTILLAALTLIGGRVFDILVYELDYYAARPWLALDWWQGGMASHGVLTGALLAAIVFARARNRPLLVILDEMVIPGALLLALGRLGNFIEGGVIGSPSTLPWAFVYPGVEGARHPVALYEAAKNLAILPVLLLALGRWPSGRGMVAALFITLYAGLRFLVDLLRDYESAWLGLGTGQVFNLAMTAAGAILLFTLMRRPVRVAPPRAAKPRGAGLLLPILLIALVLYPLGIPTSWTRANIEEKRAGSSEP